MSAVRWPRGGGGGEPAQGSASPAPERTGLKGGPRGKFPSEGDVLRGSPMCSGPSVSSPRGSWKSPLSLVGRAFPGELGWRCLAWSDLHLPRAPPRAPASARDPDGPGRGPSGASGSPGSQAPEAPGGLPRTRT